MDFINPKPKPKFEATSVKNNIQSKLKPSSFWTEKRIKEYNRSIRKLLSSPTHPQLIELQRYDRITKETLVKYKVGIIEMWKKEWICFHYKTGIQLYRREEGAKVIRSIEGSKPGNSYFQLPEEGIKEIMIIAKSPRETMLLDQLIGDHAKIIGLNSGELGSVSEEQEQYLREALKGISSVYVILDTDTEHSKSISNMLTNNINKITDSEVFQVDITRHSSEAYKDITDAVQAGKGREYVEELIDSSENVKNINSVNDSIMSSRPELNTDLIPIQFPVIVYQNLPNKLQEVCHLVDEGERRDVFLMAVLPVLATHLINVFGKNNDGDISPDFYSLVVAPAASGKGVANKARQIGEQLSNEIELWYQNRLENWKITVRSDQTIPKPLKQCLFIPANSSTRALYNLLDANEGKGIIFESEIDTMLTALKQDWGNFSDLTRKAFHHEDISLSRKEDFLSVSNPKLSLFMSGTFDQFIEMFKNSENGLYSRFALYTFNSDPSWRSQRPTECSDQLDKKIHTLSEWLLELYTKLSKRDTPLEVKMANHQWDKMDEYFENKMKEFSEQNISDGLVATIKRGGIILQRLAMIMTVIRAFEENGEDLFSKDSIITNDKDFENTLCMIDVLLKHAYHLYGHLPIRKFGINNEISDVRQADFYNNLPAVFKTKEAVEIGEKFGIAESTVKRYIKSFMQNDRLVKIQHGEYSKLSYN